MKKLIGVLLVLIGTFVFFRGLIGTDDTPVCPSSDVAEQSASARESETIPFGVVQSLQGEPVGGAEERVLSEKKDVLPIFEEPMQDENSIVLAGNCKEQVSSESEEVYVVPDIPRKDKEAIELELGSPEKKSIFLEMAICSESSIDSDVALDSYSELLLERALRESQNEAKKAAKSLMREMLAPLQADEDSFAEKLYNITSAAKGLGGNDEEYRAYVANRFAKEILADGVLQENLNAIAQEYLYALQRISSQVVIESGRDVSSFPEVSITNLDFEKIICDDAANSMDTIATAMVHETRVGAAVNVVSIGAGVACNFLVPVPFVVDFAVGVAVDFVVGGFRDSTGNIAIGAISSAEQLTEFVCFGTEEHMGFYQSLLRMSQFHNDQLRALLKSAEGMPSMREDANTFLFSEDK